MANPRLTPNRLGVGLLTAPFTADGVTITYDGTLPGGTTAAILNKAVSLTSTNLIQLTSDGEAVVGKLLLVEADLRCTVQIGGICALPSGASATITPGSKIVGDLDSSAKGFIRSAASGTAAELILARGQILNNADTAAVEVSL